MTATAKDLRIAPIKSSVANEAVKTWHYSGKVVHNSTLHLGAFIGEKLVGVMSFGGSMDKRKVIGLVRDTRWSGFLELNRMAFSNDAPRNSESRALSVAFRLIKKNYPFIEWIISFADATQCGDGTIYRAAGFVLTGITKNKTILEAPGGERVANLTLHENNAVTKQLAAKYNVDCKGKASDKKWIDAGFKYLNGFMIRYIKFLNPDARQRLTVPELPYSAIKDAGASMYLGQRT